MTDSLSSPPVSCCCSDLEDFAVVPMGGDDLDQRVFSTVETVVEHGEDAWWLSLCRCNVCQQDWLVAQEERIFDDYFLQRLKAGEAREIVAKGRWPETFSTYEQVLKVGSRLSRHCRFFDPMASSLVWTVQDLRRQRPSITVEEIASLIGIDAAHTEQLLAVEGG